MDKINRREFFKKSIAFGTAAGLTSLLKVNLYAGEQAAVLPELVAVKGGMPDTMFDAGISALGGMKKFVKKGDVVVVKPNIGWSVSPERGANTNPVLVKRVVEHCYIAGAKKVFVFDNTCNTATACYKNSGIERAVKDANGIMRLANNRSYFHDITIKKAKILKKTSIHELLLEADVFINLPVLKNHSSTRITSALKNLMGCVWDRNFYHSNGLNQSIADFCLYRKPDLNVVDAYQVMIKNGPRGTSVNDLRLTKMQLLSPDIVAIDTAAAKIYGIDPGKVSYIKMANSFNLGKMDLTTVKMKKITI